jgi:hypothetical protein
MTVIEVAARVVLVVSILILGGLFLLVLWMVWQSRLNRRRLLGWNELTGDQQIEHTFRGEEAEIAILSKGFWLTLCNVDDNEAQRICGVIAKEYRNTVLRRDVVLQLNTGIDASGEVYIEGFLSNSQCQKLRRQGHLTPRWLPFAGDGMGNYYCLEVESGSPALNREVWLMDHETGDALPSGRTLKEVLSASMFIRE